MKTVLPILGNMRNYSDKKNYSNIGSNNSKTGNLGGFHI